MNEEPLYLHQDHNRPPVSTEPVQPKSRLGSYILTVLITVFVTFSLTVGIGAAVLGSAGLLSQTGQPSGDSLTLPLDATDPDTKAAIKKLQEIYALVDEDFVEDLTEAELVESMARGLVSELDNPYTFYLSAEQNSQIADSMSGNYSGIGAVVAMNKEGLAQIVELTPGSPAIEADVRLGDIFLSVDGTDVTDLNDISTLAALVRGTEGTLVEIVFYRPSTKEEITLAIPRKRIVTTLIAAKMIEGEIGYIQIREFSNGVSKQFQEAVGVLEKQGARHLLIDLRNNGGGLATEVLSMLDFLLPDVEMTRFVGRRDGEPYTEIKQSDKAFGIPSDMRFAILTNGMTASASELMAGSLRDHGLARLIGEQSFGKGSGTITIPLEDGSAVNLTNFLYYLPKGESIEGEGLTPDEEVSLPDELKDQSLALIDPAQDTQLQAGLAYLRSLLQKAKAS